MKNEPKRMWGIDVIAVIYFAATMLLAWLYLVVNETGKLFCIGMGATCAVFSCGMIFRINVIRIVMRILLGLSMAVELVMVAYLLAGMAGLVELPPNADPTRRLAMVPLRLSLMFWMFHYLSKDEVREAFGCDV